MIHTVTFYGGPHDGFKVRIQGDLPPKIVLEETIADLVAGKKTLLPDATYYPTRRGATTYYHEENICVRTSGKRTTTPR